MTDRPNEGMRAGSPDEIEASDVLPIDAIIDVPLIGYVDCDLCEEHMLWECPTCGLSADQYQEPSRDMYFRCQCGVVLRIVKTEIDRWKREGYCSPGMLDG